MSHADFLDALGGATAVADWIAANSDRPVNRDAIYKWAPNGVPWKWRPHLVRMAIELNIPLPEDFMPEVAVQ